MSWGGKIERVGVGTPPHETKSVPSTNGTYFMYLNPCLNLGTTVTARTCAVDVLITVMIVAGSGPVHTKSVPSGKKAALLVAAPPPLVRSNRCALSVRTRARIHAHVLAHASSHNDPSITLSPRSAVPVVHPRIQFGHESWGHIRSHNRSFTPHTRVSPPSNAHARTRTRINVRDYLVHHTDHADLASASLFHAHRWHRDRSPTCSLC